MTITLLAKTDRIVVLKAMNRCFTQRVKRDAHILILFSSRVWDFWRALELIGNSKKRGC